MKHALSLLVLFAASQPAAAIVNMADIHLKRYEEGFRGELELSLNGASGNSEYQEYGVGSRLIWHRARTTDYVQLDASYGEANDETITDKGFLHARHIQAMSDKRDWELFGQAGYNEQARLNFRGLLGGGLRFRLREGDDAAAILGVGAFYAREEISEGYADAGTDELWRANSYLILRFGLSDNSYLSSTTYYQPALKEWDDYRLIETANLTVELNDHLALKLGVDIAQDSAPPEGVEKTDISYKTALSYAF